MSGGLGASHLKDVSSPSVQLGADLSVAVRHMGHCQPALYVFAG